MNLKLAIGGGIAAVITAIAATTSYFSPYMTIDSMRKSAADRDADALVKYIDFPSLRTSIKANVKTKVMQEIAKRSATDKQATPAVGEQFINNIVYPMVDKIVTPEGVSALIENRLSNTEFDFNELEKNADRADLKMGYESLDRFVVHITDREEPQKEVTLVLRRNGLAWKLSDIDISKV